MSRRRHLRHLTLTAATALLLCLSPAARAQAPQAPAASSSCAPGVTFASLLNSVGIGYTDGRLRLGPLYAVCLPAPGKPSASNYPYDPDGGGRLTTVVKRADGRALHTLVWYAEKIGTLWELSRYKVLGGEAAVKPLEPGDYVLEFAADERPFYRFPFSVSSRPSDDPYSPPGQRYFVEGAWDGYGNIYYQRNDPVSALSFTLWMQDKAGRAGRRSVPYSLRLVRERDGKTLAEDAATLGLEPRRLKAQFLLKPAGGDVNSYFKAGEVLGEDGAYSLRLTLDGKPFGQYPFAVKEGRIHSPPAGARESGDPLFRVVDYISGGRYTSWWPRRQPEKR